MSLAITLVVDISILSRRALSHMNFNFKDMNVNYPVLLWMKKKEP